MPATGFPGQRRCVAAVSAWAAKARCLRHGLVDGLSHPLRFAMSLRAVGEGPLSSIVFRRGIVDSAGDITLEPAGPYREPVRRFENRRLDKIELQAILGQMGVCDPIRKMVMERLSDPFTLLDLRGYVPNVVYSCGA